MARVKVMRDGDTLPSAFTKHTWPISQSLSTAQVCWELNAMPDTDAQYDDGADSINTTFAAGFVHRATMKEPVAPSVTDSGSGRSV